MFFCFIEHLVNICIYNALKHNSYHINFEILDVIYLYFGLLLNNLILS